MNTRQKELLCKAIELGATCWMSVKNEVCAAWLADDSTAVHFWNEVLDSLSVRESQQVTLQRLSISGTEQDVVSF